MKWQPIETAPKDGRPFIATDGLIVALVWRDEDDAKWPWQMFARWPGDRFPERNAWHDNAPTHWMPLPETPQE